MKRKSTEELEKILGTTHIDEIDAFISQNADSILTSDRPFFEYFKEVIQRKGLRRQDIFLDADIPERYGYKLITEEKRTRQRDVILRLCYAAHMTLEETQRALKYYRMPELYAKIPRDALIMIAINERPESIIDVNTFLKKNGMEVLRSSGVQE
ncbi:MAG: hypothetical protein Q4B22_07050 [Eubacteriales bacterium]|nr:hypothetical protein [Eubacteriales bacterium]